MFRWLKPRPKLFSIDPVTEAAAARIGERLNCPCLYAQTKKGGLAVPAIHAEPQDEGLVGWQSLRELVERSAAEKAEVLEPSSHIEWNDWSTVITLPAEISNLSRVEKIRLYGSRLRRLPPEIGRLAALRDLDIYTSYFLHWLPYEVLRCKKLGASRMSTRALYGNAKTLLPFPRLSAPMVTLMPTTCSVCDRGFGERTPHLWWTTQRVGTDIVPLLVHSCSNECTQSIPNSPPGFFERPHKGGGGVGMPTKRW